MSDDKAFTLDAKALENLTKALKNNMKRARVGVLGNNNSRGVGPAPKGRSINASKGIAPKVKEGAKINFTTNAAIGAIHEFGTDKMPQRSFLRVPISEHLQEKLESSGMFDEDEFKQVIKEKSLLPWLKRLAKIGEAIVSEAFETSGFGKWPKWRSKGYTNNTGQVLIDTQQLRNSITSEVK